MMRAVIIDDEKNAREAIAKALQSYCKEIEVVGMADGVDNGYHLIMEAKPDLVFLDIQMPDGSGFDLLNQIKHIDFFVVFITAYNDYAIKAFKFSAIDYILKPIDHSELIETAEKVKKAQNAKETQLKVDTFLANIHSISKDTKKIVLKTSENIHLINVKEIIRFQSDGNYTIFYIDGGLKIMVSKNIKEYYELLKDYGFFRAHQSHVVNIGYIKQFHKPQGGTLIMKDNSQVPVSTRKREELMKIFENL